MIAGAGPSGLLFLQYLRNVKQFWGEIFVVDMKEARLALAERLGATPLDVRKVDVVGEVRRRTRGGGIHYLIEATGSEAVFDWLPRVVRHQATVLIYGGAYFGGDLTSLADFQGLENTLVTSAGGSGGFDPDGTPTTYRVAMEYIRDGKIDAASILSHRYTEFGQIQRAFTEDASQQDYIKGVLILSDTA